MSDQPSKCWEPEPIALLDFFAAHVAPALLTEGWQIKQAATLAYEFAEALMKERLSRKEGEVPDYSTGVTRTEVEP